MPQLQTECKRLEDFTFSFIFIYSITEKISVISVPAQENQKKSTSNKISFLWNFVVGPWFTKIKNVMIKSMFDLFINMGF